METITPDASEHQCEDASPATAEEHGEASAAPAFVLPPSAAESDATAGDAAAGTDAADPSCQPGAGERAAASDGPASIPYVPTTDDFETFFANIPRIVIVQPWWRWAKLTPSASEQLLEGALRLASKGLRVFPLVPARVGGKGGKIPQITGWVGAATVDEKQVRAWWTYFDQANVGIATGAESDLAVLDVDYKPAEGKDGPAQLAALEAQHGPLPLGPRVKRGDSRHIYFKYDPRFRTVAGALPGLDVRAAGGLIVAPPSFHPKGGRYQWVEGTEDLPIPTAPEWLITALSSKPKTAKTKSPRAVAPQQHGKTYAPRVDNSATLKGLSPEGIAPSGFSRALIDALRTTLTVDDVLAAHELGPTPCKCPLHDGLDGVPSDNPGAFTSNEGWWWRCWTRCSEGDNSGDVIALIMRLTRCSFMEALEVAVQLADAKSGGGAA